MSLNRPVFPYGTTILLSGVNTSTSATSLSIADTTTNDKTAWAEVISSTDRNYVGIVVTAFQDQARDIVFDVGVGSAGNEVVTIPDIFVPGSRQSQQRAFSYFIPVGIPEASRVSLRWQRESGAGANDFQVFGVTGSQFGIGGFSKIETIGVKTSADTGGTQVDPGGVANTKGSWTELKSATDNDIAGIMICLGHDANAAIGVDSKILLDIGLGGAGSEQTVISNIALSKESSGADPLVPAVIPWTGFQIPAGTRVSARAQCSDTDATDRVFDVAIYGLVA